jgi:hypothetical protein
MISCLGAGGPNEIFKCTCEKAGVAAARKVQRAAILINVCIIN